MTTLMKGCLCLGILTALFGLIYTPVTARASGPTATTTPVPVILTTAELLQLVNNARSEVGHPSLVLDPYLMSYTQSVTDMAANNIPAYGQGATTSVIAMGYGYPETIDTIFCTTSFATLELNDPNPAASLPFGTPFERAVENVYYRHVGFGVAKGVADWEGYIFYQMTACYTADNKYNPDQALTPGAIPTPQVVSQVIYPVYTAMPQANGQIVHEVRAGQSLWAIAIAYQTHIKDILLVNHLPSDWDMLYEGQELLIPTLPGAPAGAPPALPVAAAKPVATLEAGNRFTPRPVMATASFSNQRPDAPTAPLPQTTTLPPETQPLDEGTAQTLIIVMVIAGCLIFGAVTLLMRK